MVRKYFFAILAIAFTANISLANISSKVTDDNSSGWIDIDILHDQGNFEPNCEYRFYGTGGYMYATSVLPTFLIGRGHDGVNRAIEVLNNAKMYAALTDENGNMINPTYIPISSMQKRCNMPDTTPSGLFGIFVGQKSCPNGWTQTATDPNGKPPSFPNIRFCIKN